MTCDDKPSVSVVFPAFNEEMNLEGVVSSALTILPELTRSFEIIIVNDGSRDQTGMVAGRLAGLSEKVKVIHHPHNRGYGAALKSGIEQAKQDLVFFCDSDGQFALEDLSRLPFTSRHDLARAYPYEMFAVPLREVVRIHSSTGSPGNPIVMGYTSRDLRHWAKLAGRILTAAGVDRDDVVQVTLSYSR